MNHRLRQCGFIRLPCTGVVLVTVAKREAAYAIGLFGLYQPRRLGYRNLGLATLALGLRYALPLRSRIADPPIGFFLSHVATRCFPLSLQ